MIRAAQLPTSVPVLECHRYEIFNNWRVPLFVIMNTIREVDANHLLPHV